jgi:hypothetical protein
LRPLQALFATLLTLVLALAAPAQAARDTNSYDGNIFALYAGDGALVPPHLSLADAMAAKRPVLLAFFLDDSAASKEFAPLLSDLSGRWGKVVELIALPSDPYQVNPKAAAGDPSHYWRGTVPQLLVLNNEGTVLLDVDGRMDPSEIEAALSKATGLSISGGERRSTSFNEINSGYGS